MGAEVLRPLGDDCPPWAPHRQPWELGPPPSVALTPAPCCPTGESAWHPVSSGIPDCYYNVTHLPVGVTVRFRVACANRAGQGPFSNPSEKVIVRGTQGQRDRVGGMARELGFYPTGTMVMIFFVSTQIPQFCHLLLTKTPLLPQGQPGPRRLTLLPQWPRPHPPPLLLSPQSPRQPPSAPHLPQHPPARPCPHSRPWVHLPKLPQESTGACRLPSKQSPRHPVPRPPQVSPSLPSPILGPQAQPPPLKGLNQRLPLLPCIWSLPLCLHPQPLNPQLPSPLLSPPR